MQSVVEIWHFGEWNNGDISEYCWINIVLELFCCILDVYGKYRCYLSSVFWCSSCTWFDTILHRLLWSKSYKSHRSCWYELIKYIIFVFTFIHYINWLNFQAIFAVELQFYFLLHHAVCYWMYFEKNVQRCCLFH